MLSTVSLRHQSAISSTFHSTVSFKFHVVYSCDKLQNDRSRLNMAATRLTSAVARADSMLSAWCSDRRSVSALVCDCVSDTRPARWAVPTDRLSPRPTDTTQLTRLNTHRPHTDQDHTQTHRHAHTHTHTHTQSTDILSWVTDNKHTHRVCRYSHSAYTTSTIT